MKNLLFFLAVVAAIGLYFHDKNAGEQIAKLQEENTQLNQQITDKDSALNALQLKVQQARATLPATSLMIQSAPASGAPPVAASSTGDDWRFKPTTLDPGQAGPAHSTKSH